MNNKQKIYPYRVSVNLTESEYRLITAELRKTNKGQKKEERTSLSRFIALAAVAYLNK